MILDGLILISAVMGFYRGFSKGIVASLLSIIGVLLASILSMRLSTTLAEYLTTHNYINSQYVTLIAFIIIFLGTILVIRIIIRAVEKLLKVAMLSTVNKLVGGLLYAMVSLFFISSICWLGNKAGVLADGIKNESKLYTYIAPIAPVSIQLITAYLPYCKDIYSKIQAGVGTGK
jgi:membrane protein required for colicin V production